MTIDPQILALGGGVAAVVAVVFVGFWASRRKKEGKPEVSADEAVSTEAAPAPAKKSAADDLTIKPLNLKDRLKTTRERMFSGLSGLLGSSGDLEGKEWDELEEALLGADISFATVDSLLEGVRNRMKEGEGQDLKAAIREECNALFVEGEKLPLMTGKAEKPFVVSVVGINGVGKTTTIGKLAKRFSQGGRDVLLGAADTFRAGAISQLKVWSERVGCQFVAGREQADPGAVAFDSVTAGKARGMDVVLLDTAGRLHTKQNLMDELKKIHRVVKKVIPEAPHEVWLILDGTLGQNSVVQAKQFCESLGVTGIIVTKLDGTAKGGAILSIAKELGLPVRFIGVGEGVDDLIPFEPQQFLDAILN